MHSAIYEISNLASLVFTSKPSEVKKGTFKYVQNAGFFNPSWLFNHFYMPHYLLHARYFKVPSSLEILSLWFSLVTDFFLGKKKKQLIISPIVVSLPPDEYFWNLIYFCKTRQNWNIPQATNNSMHIISFFPPLKVVFFLGQNLIEKPRFLWITWRQIIIAHTFRASKHLNQESI